MTDVRPCNCRVADRHTWSLARDGLAFQIYTCAWCPAAKLIIGGTMLRMSAPEIENMVASYTTGGRDLLTPRQNEQPVAAGNAARDGQVEPPDSLS